MKKPTLLRRLLILAEKEGFEPPDPCRSTVFKTAAIDHSAISPGAKLHIFSFVQQKKSLDPFFLSSPQT